MERVAIVGTGVAGLACALALRGRAEITLLEKDPRPGGHTNTVTVDEHGTPRPIDTGFIVFNKVTYPNLCRLFDELQVRVKPSEMSFSVQHLPDGLEYNGMGPNKVFAQRRNLFRPRFHRFLGQVQRFFQVARDLIDAPEAEPMTLRAFTAKHGLGDDFLNYYLVPMSSAVWSTEPGDILNFPAATLIRFFHNHGFLGVDTHHQWFTVDGGSRTYLEKIVAAVGAPRLGAGAARVEESAAEATVVTEGCERLTFDRVVLACHGDQALAALAAPDEQQQRLLAPFRYQRNHVTLHTDASVMPKKRLAWASWNYRVEAHRATTHYWMNALQGVSPTTDYFVSLNCAGEFPPDRVLYETVYDHPVFTLGTMQAQNELPALNARGPAQRIFFCGSYFKYGFHEDACTAGLHAAEAVGRVIGAA